MAQAINAAPDSAEATAPAATAPLSVVRQWAILVLLYGFIWEAD